MKGILGGKASGCILNINSKAIANYIFLSLAHLKRNTLLL